MGHRPAASRSDLPSSKVQAEVSESHIDSAVAARLSHTLQIPQYDATQCTAESFGSVYQISDMPDLFEQFDPGFNLDAVDLALV